MATGGKIMVKKYVFNDEIKEPVKLLYDASKEEASEIKQSFNKMLLSHPIPNQPERLNEKTPKG